MATETERKFLVDNSQLALYGKRKERLKQGYLCSSDDAVTRIRTIDDRAVLTVKSRNPGITRAEFEYDIPYNDAIEMLELCESVVEKTRYYVPQGDLTWEIDIFEGKLRGLYLAEIEGTEEQVAAVDLPPFIGEEVSTDVRYSNHSLSENGVPSDV
jgi:adenylate cyclase